MRIRHVVGAGEEEVELQMTPMIDIVFQLLIFFIMTFKIAMPEGDFNIRMPPASTAPTMVEDIPLPPITVRLTAGPDGRIASIQMGERALRSFRELHDEIIALVGGDAGPSAVAKEAEVELDCDYDLQYRYAVEAITAISGRIDNTTDPPRIIPLVEKVKFAPSRPPAGG